MALRINFVFLSLLVLFGLTFAWEQCYYEEASPFVRVLNANLKLVENNSDLPDVMACIETELNTPIISGRSQLTLWNEETGLKAKYRFGDLRDFSCQQNTNGSCLINHTLNGCLVEQLHREGIKFEATLQVFGTPQDSNQEEELVCVVMRFNLPPKKKSEPEKRYLL